jgi:low affinity Fe/Cu permease
MRKSFRRTKTAIEHRAGLAAQGHTPRTSHGIARMSASSLFTRMAKWASRFTGRPLCFALALLVVLGWIVTGPIFRYSNTWQLVINTGTTIVTFLMVFLIQNAQNRDTEAIQLKLDELIRATRGAHNALLDLEELEEHELDEFRARYAALAKAARECMDDDETERGTPEVDAPRSQPPG